ncbi:MAG: penicillin-binding transpeptidase domain-containing protein [Herbinix sp.]|nr:penicillin-binding transpeptidase domain-containing protein [Herbinix sp.]
MFDVFLDYVKKLLKSRLFPITLIYLALFCVVINRIFVLQIVEGPAIAQESTLKDTESRDIESTRGNIYDRNGKLLASNALTYSVVMTDSTKIESNEQRNAIIYQMIQIIEKNGDTLDNEFYIQQNKDGKLEFTIDDNELTRFKKQAFTYVLEEDETTKAKNLTEEENNATAEQVYEFLRTGEGYENTNSNFDISDSYSVEDTLKIMGVRYALFCNYPKYLQITVASNVSDKTIAAIEENSDKLLGVEIKQQTNRVYQDGIYLSNIIGYTGLISSNELEKYNNDDTMIYDSTDYVGKTGLEQKYEEVLRGTKGSETVSVTTSDKVIDVIDHTDPIAGNNIYLTIDSDLQISTYHLLEKELARILLMNITPDLNYGSKGESAADIKIPIYEVYYALLNNNIIDIDQFDDPDATSLEQQTYNEYKNTLKDVFIQLDTLLSSNNTITNNNAGDMEDYLDYFYSVLLDNDILIRDNIPSDDTTLAEYKNDKISLSSLLKYALANNWVDLSKLGVGDEYYSAEELYQKLITYTEDILKNDKEFNKKIYRNLVFSYKLSGTEICLLLLEQGVLKYNKDELNNLKNGAISAYSFITDKIKSLEITPAMLALTPCSGSVVITDVNTGDVLAMVTYPGYDNNKFAGKIDSDYFTKINNDLSTPMRNRPTSEKTAPGSTFKMVTSVAALEEGVVTPTDTIFDLGEFTKISPSPKCHIYPGSHGSVNIIDALAVSCNYYFFEMGWRLSIDGSGKFDAQQGLNVLKKYATLFGLDETSGMELGESNPQISTTDPVRSSIGQGSNVYTPVQLSRYVTTIANRGTCFNLTLLEKIEGNDGSIIKDNSAIVNHKLDNVSSSTWDAVFKGMYSVVNTGEGSVYSLFNNFDVTVAGKTGTSQLSKVVPNNALFVSFAPYENPEISVTAVIPNGYTSHNAAELTKNIYTLYFNVQDKKSILNSDISASDTNDDSAIE